MDEPKTRCVYRDYYIGTGEEVYIKIPVFWNFIFVKPVENFPVIDDKLERL